MRLGIWWGGVAMAGAISATLVAQPAQFSFDYPAIAGRVIQQLHLQAGETVLIVAMPGTFEDLVPHLRHAVMKAGGVDLGVIDVLREPVPVGFDLALLQKSAAASRAAYKDMLRGVDAAIMMPGAVPAHPVYAAMQDWLREGRGRTVHFHWLENGSAYTLPGQPLPPRHVIDATSSACCSTPTMRPSMPWRAAPKPRCAAAWCASPRRLARTCSSASARGR